MFLIPKIMKTINRNSDTKRHLRTSFSNENIWFYTDGDAENQLNSGPKEGVRNDRESVRQKNYSLKISEEQPKVKSKESAFIVDWQIYDEG